ncbi:MurR/RpiR family transcriptional regulator [Loigolactobacillus coryniformis]|uniref:Transcription regulator n=1 Tax=Loigolactobacillus coryniformis subsp. coryniformis CECT 5711 TaxID=1185325 RepID=J3JAZ5_9LACO|nr:MurR/RpiR family transcriptional regulator [Loigolactobacillus coryniformis]EJN55279.1 Transcription regulator [Loigolactobacillus coryniformis subsp. coryniformis CECT 5711]MDC4187078.1 MurR/RpiR family transcriptional regulator [Loigolactobacillus coryniformis]MDN5952238.1 MurR/RpiR family transcriptional regulator [Loigolactobacillus coryniformis]MDN5954681.1 MurR/RpiR family transcriptional regulator [Loigolactobacillus coryniformis]
MENIMQLVEAQYADFSRQERKVALKVLQEPEKIQQLSINHLAASVGVSNATITRFVKKMQCANFQEFKLRLAKLVPVAPSLPTKGTIADDVYNFYQKVLQATQQLLDPATLAAVVQVIQHSQRLYLFGLGSSGYTANEMTQRLIRMGITAFAMTDSHMMYITSGIMQPGDTVLVLSTSGNTVEVNQAVTVAKKNGAQIIAITGFSHSPLQEQSDLAVVVKNSNFVDNSRFVNSQFALTYVLDIITTMLLENEHYRTKMDQTIEMIMNNKLKNH